MKVDIKEAGCEDVDWICLTQGKVHQQAFVNMVVNFWVPQRWGTS